MRILFIAPLVTARVAHPLSALAQIMIKLGHEVQLLVRQNTRVRTDKGAVLSRNEASVEKLRQQVGADLVALLHTHRSGQVDSADARLDEVDALRVHGWMDMFCPDLVILSGTDLVADDPVLRAFHTRSPAPRALQLRSAPGQASTLADAAGAVVTTIVHEGDVLRKALGTALPKLLDRARSTQGLVGVLDRERARLIELVNGTDAPPVVPVAQKKAGLAPPEVRGELESIKDGDVVFGSTLWFKGWIDWSPALAIREIEVLINDRTHRVVPSGVRGDMAERLASPDILGFDVRLPLYADGPPLRVAVVLLHKDGRKQVWQRRSVWANDSIPEQHVIPIIVGDAAIVPVSGELASGADTSNWLRGTLRVNEHTVRRLVLFQRGVRIGQVDLKAATGTSVAGQNSGPGAEYIFGHSLANSVYEQSQSLELWIEWDDGALIHWRRCDPLHEPTCAIANWSLIGVADGDVVRGDTLACELGPLADDARPIVFVNGRHVDTTQVPSAQQSHWSLAVPFAHAGNDVQIRIECGDTHRTLQLWRHVDAPQPSQWCNVAVPERSSVAPHGAAQGRTRSVLVIRKAPSPTDELYLLGPLLRLASAGLVRVKTIDLDTDAEQPADTDALLTAGTIVVISRYISDRWISALTRHKRRLGPVYYLMDDDVAAAVDTGFLPGGYRTRMTKVACGEFQTMIKLCDRFLVTSEHLRKRYSSGKTDLIEPPFLHPPKDLKHLDSDNRIVVTYQGTEGHRDDLSAIAPALRTLHDLYPQVHLQIIIGNLRFVPAPLKGLPRCEAIPPMPWPAYKEFRAKARAHIALAPILDTPYNRGKSIVKIFDISALGAVGVYTNSAPYNTVIEHGVNGMLVENDPQMWFKALKWLIERPEEIRRLAKEGQKLALDIGDLAHLEKYWMHQMELKVQHA